MNDVSCWLPSTNLFDCPQNVTHSLILFPLARRIVGVVETPVAHTHPDGEDSLVENAVLSVNGN